MFLLKAFDIIIALGLALSNSERHVVCLDGDGAIIMHMGC